MLWLILRVLSLHYCVNQVRHLFPGFVPREIRDICINSRQPIGLVQSGQNLLRRVNELIGRVGDLPSFSSPYGRQRRESKWK